MKNNHKHNITYVLVRVLVSIWIHIRHDVEIISIQKSSSNGIYSIIQNQLEDTKIQHVRVQTIR